MNMYHNISIYRYCNRMYRYYIVIVSIAIYQCIDILLSQLYTVLTPIQISRELGHTHFSFSVKFTMLFFICLCVPSAGLWRCREKCFQAGGKAKCPVTGEPSPAVPERWPQEHGQGQLPPLGCWPCSWAPTSNCRICVCLGCLGPRPSPPKMIWEGVGTNNKVGINMLKHQCFSERDEMPGVSVSSLPGPGGSAGGGQCSEPEAWNQRVQPQQGTPGQWKLVKSEELSKTCQLFSGNSLLMKCNLRPLLPVWELIAALWLVDLIAYNVLVSPTVSILHRSCDWRWTSCVRTRSSLWQTAKRPRVIWGARHSCYAAMKRYYQYTCVLPCVCVCIQPNCIM